MAWKRVHVCDRCERILGNWFFKDAHGGEYCSEACRDSTTGAIDLEKYGQQIREALNK